MRRSIVAARALALGLAAAAVGAHAATEDKPPADAAMVAIPGGSFSQGVKSFADHPRSVGVPGARTVSVAPFLIDKTEVTAAQYAACLRAGACAAPRFPPGTCQSSKSADCAQDCNINRGPAFAHHPMNCATWETARAYCRWAGKRLPTEAEWERAARGGDGRVYPWGKGPPKKQLCWNHGDVRVDKTCPVGAFPAGASPYGVLDLAGNVAEWTSTSYDGGGKYVVKGGGFFTNAGDEDDDPPEWIFRADVPEPRAPTEMNFDLGFRCARDGAPAAAAAAKPTETTAAHPASGSPERKAILDAVRAKLATTVEFKVVWLAVVGDVAYFEGQEHKAAGRAVGALLRREGAAWTVAELATADGASAEGGPVQALRDRLRRGQPAGEPGRNLPVELFAP